MLENIKKLKFQFQNGSIKAKEAKGDVTKFECFNSKMVRLKRP